MWASQLDLRAECQQRHGDIAIRWRGEQIARRLSPYFARPGRQICPPLGLRSAGVQAAQAARIVVAAPITIWPVVIAHAVDASARQAHRFGGKQQPIVDHAS